MDYKQDSLLGKKTISTVSYDEKQIFRDILFLHANGKDIDCDPCYSIGNFYKNTNLKQPKYKFDKYPKSNDVVEAMSWNLPLENESCEVINFDPPFLIGGSDTCESNKDGSSVIAKRFTSFKNFDELKVMYSESLKEFYRILKQDGIVIFKCQDCISSSLNYFSHCYIMNESVRLGFYPKDLFILISQHVMIGNVNKQQHARKFHSYFWILKKSKCKIDYKYKLHLDTDFDLFGR